MKLNRQSVLVLFLAAFTSFGVSAKPEAQFAPALEDVSVLRNELGFIERLAVPRAMVDVPFGPDDVAAAKDLFLGLLSFSDELEGLEVHDRLSYSPTSESTVFFYDASFRGLLLLDADASLTITNEEVIINAVLVLPVGEHPESEPNRLRTGFSEIVNQALGTSVQMDGYDCRNGCHVSDIEITTDCLGAGASSQGHLTVELAERSACL